MSTSHTVSGRDYGRLFDMISAPIKTRLLQSGLDLRSEEHTSELQSR